MSMRGSPINWWKEKRQSSHTGIPHANRPQTAFPWNEDHDISKIVEQAVLAAFESNAFKIAVASQVDPAFSRHQEKLNQLKTTNLNLESTLQAHVEDLPVVLKGIEDQLTRVVIPDYRHSLDTLALGQESLEKKVNEIHIPDHSDELNEIVSGQARFLKSFESRLSALESRIEDLDRKTGDVDEAVVNADLRSAIRFGEISNELQDRNTTLNNSIWEVQRELGKKTDALQRRVVGACDDMGKSIRASAETIETMRAKLDEDDVLAAVNKVSSRAEFSEKALRRSITAIQDKVSGLDTSAIPVQVAKLETIERGMSDFKKEAEAARNLASVSSKFLSANTSKLDSMASAVGKMHLMVESTNEICQELSESQEVNAGSIKEDVEAVRMHVRSLDNLGVSHARKLSDAYSILTRTEGAVVAFDAAVIGRLGDLASSAENIEERLRPLSSHSTKLEGLETSLTALIKDSKPQKATLDDLAKTLSEMRSNVDTVLSSHTDSLSTIHQTVSNTTSKDGLSKELSNLQSSIEKKISASHETASQSAVEAITTHVGSLDRKLQSGFQTLKEDTESRAQQLHSPVSQILEEVRSNKALFETEKAEIREEFNTTKTAIELSRSELGVDALAIKRMIQDIQETSKYEEILLQVESWGQSCISKQAAEVASAKELLESSRGRDESLQKSVDGLNEKSAEISTFLKSGKLESASTTHELGALKRLLENESKTSSTIKHLAQQNASSLATAYEGILSLDTKLTTNSDAIHSSIQDVQTTFSKDILDATTTLTTSMHDDVADLKADLSSRVSTSTNVLRAEIKSIDLATTSSALEALKIEVETSAKRGEEWTRSVAEDVKSAIEDKIVDLGRDVKDFGNTIGKDLQLNNAALENFKELSMSNSAALTSNLKTLQQTVDPIAEVVDGVSATAVVVKDIDAVTKENKETLSTMRESLAASIKKTDAYLSELKSVVEAGGEKTLQAVQDSHTVLIDIQKSSKEESAKANSGIEGLDSALSNIARTSKETEAAILASAAGISADILAVKSDLGGVSSALTKVEEHAAKSAEGQREVLSAVQGSSTDFDGLQKSLKRVEGSITSRISEVSKALETTSHDSKEAHAATLSALTSESQAVRDTLATESEKTIKSRASELEEVKDAIETGSKSTREDLLNAVGGVGQAIQVSKDELAELVRLNGSKLDTAATTSGKRQEETLSALQTESKTTRDSIKNETEKALAALVISLDATKKSIISEVTGVRDTLSANNDAITSKVQEASDTVIKMAAENIESQSTIFSTLRQDLENMKEVLIAESQACKVAVLEDLAVVKTENQEARDAISGVVKEGNLKFDDAAADAMNMCKEVIASVEAQSRVLFDTMKTELKDVSGTVEAAKETTVAEIQKAKTGHDEKVGAVKVALLGSLDGVKRDLSEESSKSRKDLVERIEKLTKDIDAGISQAASTHEAALQTMKENNTTLSDLILHESTNTNAAIVTARDLTTSELQQYRTSVDEKLDSVEQILSGKVTETNGIITQEIGHLASKAYKNHKDTLEEIKLTSEIFSTGVGSAESNIKDTIKELSQEAEKHRETIQEAVKLATETCLTGLDRTELHLEDTIKELSSNIDAASHKSTLNHTTTLDAISLTGTTLTKHITTEVSTSTASHTASSQSLLTSLTTAQSTLDTLQTTTTTLSTDTAAHFSSATSARKKADKKAEANTDTILEAIRQQGKTTSSSVDAVQKVILTGVQNLNSSLEGYIERSISKFSSDMIEIAKSGLEDVKSENVEMRKVVDGKMEGLMGSVKEEGDLTRISTKAIEAHTSNLSSQLSKGFTDLATQNKSTSSALNTHVSTLSSAIKDEAETTQARVETLHSRVLDEVQKTDTALRTSLTTLKSSIDHSDTKLEALIPSLKAIDAAVRVNSAAIARVDKAVLESSSQVKSEIHSSITSLSSSLDEDLSETSRRVRGIAEFEIPRLEVLLRRQRDAVEVIGGRVIGTTKRFDEMVAGVGKGNGGGGGLGGSEILGMSGRLRGGSNASSTRSKDSGYRMGAFESGGRM